MTTNRWGGVPSSAVISGANNVLPAKRLTRWQGFGENLSESVLVRDFTYVDDGVSSRRTLCIETVDRRGTDCSTRKQ
jgi:hypothetical protein